jgi:hypothetical protein
LLGGEGVILELGFRVALLRPGLLAFVDFQSRGEEGAGEVLCWRTGGIRNPASMA